MKHTSQLDLFLYKDNNILYCPVLYSLLKKCFQSKGLITPLHHDQFYFFVIFLEVADILGKLPLYLNKCQIIMTIDNTYKMVSKEQK